MEYFFLSTALVKLSRPVKLVGESRIRAVCLPNKRLTYNDTGMCIATGWGRDAENGILAGKLLETKVPVHDNAICRKKYGHSVNIRSGHLCAGHLDGSTGTCVVRFISLKIMSNSFGSSKNKDLFILKKLLRLDMLGTLENNSDFIETITDWQSCL